MIKFLNKKGDLNLSINAIVILIIAIVFLGLALTFTRNIILGSSGKLLAGVEGVDLQNPANAEQVITTDSKFQVKSGDSKAIKFSVYNKLSSTLRAVQPRMINTSCVPSGISYIKLEALNASINPNSEMRYQTIFSATGISNDYICTIWVGNSTTINTNDPQIQVAVRIDS